MDSGENYNSPSELSDEQTQMMNIDADEENSLAGLNILQKKEK